MKAVYNKKMYISASMCDAAGLLGLHNTFALFQDIASEHAEELGVGFDDMTRRKSFWMTVRTRVHFYRRPAIMRQVELTTWPAVPGKARCDRFYRLAQNEEVLAEGRTEWCVFDLEKNTVKSPGEAGFIDGIEYLEETLLHAPYARFKHDFADEDCALKYTVRTTDVDMGRHMNNVAYLRMLTDSFSVAELESMDVSEMEIMFYTPCFEGEQLDVLRRKTDYGWEFGVRKPNGRYAALAQMRAEEK